jgi:hypothetical protein
VFKQTFCPPHRLIKANDDEFVQTSPHTTGNVLDNDRIEGCRDVEVTPVCPPKYGQVAINPADGSFVFNVDGAPPNTARTPISDSFVYQVKCLSTGQVTIATVTLQGRWL